MNLVIGSNNELSVNELDEFDLNVFPNPIDSSDQFLNIKMNNTYSKNISIFDLTGRKVFSTITQNDRIDVSSLSVGTYILEISVSDKIHRSKLIVK